MNDFQLEILLASSINTGLIFQNNNTTDEKDGLVHPTSCVTLYYVQCHSSGSRLKDNIHAGVISNQAVTYRGNRADTSYYFGGVCGRHNMNVNEGFNTSCSKIKDACGWIYSTQTWKWCGNPPHHIFPWHNSSLLAEIILFYRYI